ncbi:hypothetical protein L9F63_001110, partial [Diploptera punctata]
YNYIMFVPALEQQDIAEIVNIVISMVESNTDYNSHAISILTEVYKKCSIFDVLIVIPYITSGNTATSFTGRKMKPFFAARRNYTDDEVQMLLLDWNDNHSNSYRVTCFYCMWAVILGVSVPNMPRTSSVRCLFSLFV